MIEDPNPNPAQAHYLWRIAQVLIAYGVLRRSDSPVCFMIYTGNKT